MNTYRTVTAAYLNAGLSRSAAVEFGQLFEGTREAPPEAMQALRHSMESWGPTSRPLRDQSEDREPVRYIVVALQHREHGLVYYVMAAGSGYRVTVYTRDPDVALEWALLREQGWRRHHADRVQDSDVVNISTTAEQVRSLRALIAR